ncbi:UNVERIFIED_CONTAM: 40S ribosomal protein S10-1 [Sesamum angustifolium]|uniref:40S ribosomal protein S10-1 n=1 Tax=Sesamum angustifolium TaxID=2727405 RepID=A0AAW2PV19_9LAMI
MFTEGVCYAKKDFNLAKHPEIDVPNLQVIKLMQSFKSKEYVRETFAWMHYYWYLTNDGIEFLRTYLNLPSEIVPATLKKSARPLGRSMGGPPAIVLVAVYFGFSSVLRILSTLNRVAYFKIYFYFFHNYACLGCSNSGPPRFEGDRPRFGDRDGYRGGPRAPPGEFGGEKGGAPADYQPAFRGGAGGRPGFGRGAGGFGGAPSS